MSCFRHAGKAAAWLLLALGAVPSLLAQTETPPAREATSPQAPAADLKIDADAPLPQPAPGDYQASEQISEDLSVSFPVDI